MNKKIKKIPSVFWELKIVLHNLTFNDLTDLSVFTTILQNAK